MGERLTKAEAPIYFSDPCLPFDLRLLTDHGKLGKIHASLAAEIWCSLALWRRYPVCFINPICVKDMIATQEMGRQGQRTAQTARRLLRASSHHGVRRVKVDCDENGVLRLHGRLASYYLKQLAQETVSGIPEVVELVNDTEVVAAGTRYSSSRAI